MESVYENIPKELSVNDVKEVLRKMDERLNSGEGLIKIQEAKDLAGEDMVELMRIVFPIVVDIQLQVVSELGLLGLTGKEGLKEFLIKANQYSREDEEVNRIFTAIRHIYLPPFTPIPL